MTRYLPPFALAIPFLQLVMAIAGLARATLCIHEVTAEIEKPGTHQPIYVRHYTADPEDVDSSFTGNKVIFIEPQDLPRRANPLPNAGVAIAALSLPGIIGEIFTSLPTAWPDSWYPQFLGMWQWRAISWPIFAIPFGWMVGRAVDAVRGLAVRVRMVEAFPLLALAIFLLIFLAWALSSGESRDYGNGVTQWMIGGGFLWGTLCFLPAMAWFFQMRERRKVRLAGSAANVGL